MKTAWRNLRERLRRRLLGRRLFEALEWDTQTLARLGNRHYHGTASPAAPGFTPDLSAFEYRVHSQNGEDGILLELLARVGPAGHRVVEIGTGDGRECNSANLVLAFGWQADLFEASAGDAAEASAYFESRAGDRVRVHPIAVTPENVDARLREAAAAAEPDVLSIDIDGIDYWVWRAVEAARPRLVVIEYNASLGPDRALTVPPDFQPRPGLQSYHGASLTALTRLAAAKGYLLAGCESRGINAFYVRTDLAAAAGIEPAAVAEAFRPHYWRSRRLTVEQQYATVAGLPWVEV